MIGVAVVVGHLVPAVGGLVTTVSVGIGHALAKAELRVLHTGQRRLARFLNRAVDRILIDIVRRAQNMRVVIPLLVSGNARQRFDQLLVVVNVHRIHVLDRRNRILLVVELEQND